MFVTNHVIGSNGITSDTYRTEDNQILNSIQPNLLISKLYGYNADDRTKPLEEKWSLEVSTI